MFKRTEYLTSSVKGKLINSFLNKEISKSFQKSFESELTQKTISKEKSKKDLESNSKSFENTRPSSANSANRVSQSLQKKIKPTNINSAVPTNYQSLVKIFKEKIHFFNESLRNDNTDYLLFSFIILYTGIWGNDLENPILSFMQANIWNTYREILAKNDISSRIPLFPRMVRLKKIPQEELKKALSWFCMINYEKLETFKELYEFLRETFLYARKFYFISIILPEFKQSNKNTVKVENKKSIPKALNDSVVRYQTPMNSIKNGESRFLTPNFQRNKDKKVFLSTKAMNDLGNTFKIFWNKYSSDGEVECKSKENVFNDFKKQFKTPLGTESALHVLKLISEKLKN